MDFKKRVIGGAKLDFWAVKRKKIVVFKKYFFGVSIAFLHKCV